MTRSSTALDAAEAALRSATSLIVGAGAGLGVDSGLPDFRGPEGFWRAYPPLRRLGLSFEESANPSLFRRDPRLGWGFYGHRALLYRATRPHDGFDALLEIARALDLPLFAVTSNVDGHFQRAGFPAERVWEVHGSIHHLQCFRPCSREVWPNDLELVVDEDELLLRSPVPECPRCGDTARPNILMFGDWSWIGDRSDARADRYARFLESEAGSRPAYVEIGAGTAVPTIRHEGLRVAQRGGAIVRINPREPGISAPHVGIAAGARETLLELRDRVTAR